jgi:transcriptional regulator with XRE-family HTH domain
MLTSHKILSSEEQSASGPFPDRGRKAVFAERLKALMVEKRLSVSSLSMLVQNELPGEKFNPVNISHYRAGRSMPRPRILQALTRALSVEMDDLAPAAKAESTPVAPEFDDGKKTSGSSGPEISAALATPTEAQGAVPSFHLEDLEEGEAWLQINQRLSWTTVIKILQALKGEL